MAPIAESDTATNGHPTSELRKNQLKRPAPEIIEAPLPNPSLQITADHQLKSVEAPVYAPRAGEVLLHVKATGVCG